MITDRVKQILSFYSSDSVGVKTNLARLLNHGSLAGTGKLEMCIRDSYIEGSLAVGRREEVAAKLSGEAILGHRHLDDVGLAVQAVLRLAAGAIQHEAVDTVGGPVVGHAELRLSEAPDRFARCRRRGRRRRRRRATAAGHEYERSGGDQRTHGVHILRDIT